MKLFPGVPPAQKAMMLVAFAAVATVSLGAQKERFAEISTMTLEDASPRIIDGDTVDLNGGKVRIVGIDAPDADVAYLKSVSTAALASLSARDGGLVCSRNVFDFALRREEQCVTNTESYGRLNLACRLKNNNASVGATMVAQGYAVDYRRYSGGAYVELMQKAARDRVGLWGVDYDRMRMLASRRAVVPKDCEVDTITR